MQEKVLSLCNIELLVEHCSSNNSCIARHRAVSGALVTSVVHTNCILFHVMIHYAEEFIGYHYCLKSALCF